MGTFRRILIALSLCFSTTLLAQTTSPEFQSNAGFGRDTVAQFIRTVESYQAAFEQTLVDEAGTELETESGRFWLQRPGQFRWEYTSPWERQIVANQERIWMYDAELQQVTMGPAEGALQASPAALLAGDLSALDDYTISATQEDDGYTAVRLEPTAGYGDFSIIVLGFMDGDLVQLDLHDRFGQTTIVRFSALVRNPALDAALFQFVVPEGVDVIDQGAD